MKIQTCRYFDFDNEFFRQVSNKRIRYATIEKQPR